MTRSSNGSPQDPRNFLEGLQRDALKETQQESSGQLDQTQQATSPPEPGPLQDSGAAAAAAAAIAVFSSKVLIEVYHLVCERDEVQHNNKALGEESKQMRLTIDALTETIAARDVSIEELTARIETLTKEKAKLQTA